MRDAGDAVWLLADESRLDGVQRSAGGRVAYGTDLGNGAIPPGIDLREALLLHEAARMPPEDVLEAMTATSLHPGAPADLIALGGDPLERMDALGEVRLVVRAGRVVASR